MASPGTSSRMSCKSRLPVMSTWTPAANALARTQASASSCSGIGAGTSGRGSTWASLSFRPVAYPSHAEALTPSRLRLLCRPNLEGRGGCAGQALQVPRPRTRLSLFDVSEPSLPGFFLRCNYVPQGAVGERGDVGRKVAWVTRFR